MCLAIPGQIIEITGGDELDRQGRVSFGGVVKTASLAFVPEAETGQFVLVHAGVAIGVIDEEEAMKMFECLSELEALNGEEGSP